MGTLQEEMLKNGLNKSEFETDSSNFLSFDDNDFQEVENDEKKRIKDGDRVAEIESNDIIDSEGLTPNQQELVSQHLNKAINLYQEILKKNEDENVFWDGMRDEMREEGGFRNNELNKVVNTLKENVKNNSVVRRLIAQKTLNKDLAQGLSDIVSKTSHNDVGQEKKDARLDIKTEIIGLKGEIAQLEEAVEKHFEGIKIKNNRDIVNRRLDEKLTELKKNKQKALKIKSLNKQSAELEKIAEELHAMTSIKLREGVLKDGKKNEDVDNNSSLEKIKKEVKSILSEDLKNKYLKQFTKSSDLEKKAKHFDRTIASISNRIIREEVVFEDVSEYVNDILSNGAVYSTINIALNEQGGKKNKEQNKNMNMEKIGNPKDTDMNESEKFDKEIQRRKEEQKKEKFPETHSKKDKEVFQEEWATVAAANREKARSKMGDVEEGKFDTSMIERGVVDNPEAAAMGGFDHKSEDVKEKKVKMDTHIERGVVDNPEAAAIGGFDRVNEKDGLEELKSVVAEKRNLFAQKQYKNNKAWARVKKIFGQKRRDGDDPDMQSLKQDYYNSLEEYRKAKMNLVESKFAKLDEQSLAKQKEMYEEASGEVYAEMVQEAVYNLREARQQARAEDLGGNALVDKMKGVGKWLQNSKAKKVLLMSSLMTGGVALFARKALAHAPTMATKIGVGENTIAMAGAEKMAFAAKFMTPIGVGIGAGLAAQWMQKKMFESDEKKQAKEFENMSWEEKEEFFVERNYDMLLKKSDTLDNMKNKSAVIGAIAGAGAFMISGSISAEEIELDAVELDDYSYNSVVGEFTTNMRDTEAFEEFQEKYGSEAHAKFLEENSDNSNAEKSWQKSVRRAGDRYANRARIELGEKGISVYDLDDAEKRVAQKATRLMSEANSDDLVNKDNLDTMPITQEHIEDIKISADEERDFIEEYLIKLNKEGVDITGKKLNDILKETTPEQMASVVGGGMSADQVTKEIMKSSYEVPDDWESHDVHNFHKDVSKDDVLGTSEGLSESVAQQQHKSYELFDSATKEIEQNAQNKITEPLRKAVEVARQQMEALAEINAEHSESNVNIDLLQKRLQEAIGTYDMDVVDSIEEGSKNIEIESTDSVEEYNAMDQMDNSGEADNPMSQGFSDIKIIEDNKGILEISKGDSVKSRLAEFLVANSNRLTEGGMGWNPQDSRWQNVDEWANDRAVGLAAEIAENNPGIDIDFIRPGSNLIVDLADTGDIKVGVEFEGGPHIVPSQEKIKFNLENTQSDVSAISQEESKLDSGNVQDDKMVIDQEVGAVNGDEKVVELNSNDITASEDEIVERSQEMLKKEMVRDMNLGIPYEIAMAENALEFKDNNAQFYEYVLEQETLNQELEGGIINQKAEGGIVRERETVGEYIDRMMSIKESNGGMSDNGSVESTVEFDFDSLTDSESKLFAQQMVDMFRDNLRNGQNFSEILNMPAYNMGGLNGDFSENPFSFEQKAMEILNYDENVDDYLTVRKDDSVKSLYKRLAKVAKEKGKFNEVFSYSERN